MSRRSRRLLPVSVIAVLLIGLVLALAFYVVMWLPVNPLRFRPIAYLDDDMVPVDYPRWDGDLVHMTVENTSSSTVYLAKAYVARSDLSDIRWCLAYLSAEEQAMPGALAATNGSAIIIPPRRTVHCIAVASLGRDAELSRGVSPVQYHWETDERYQFLKAWSLVHSLLPENLQSHLRVSGLRYDTIPLELPPPLPSSENK
jgi:hypothetical protein